MFLYDVKVPLCPSSCARTINSLILFIGPALAWVPWVPANPQIFQQVDKEPTKFEDGKLSLLRDAKIRNPQIEIPNEDPVH